MGGQKCGHSIGEAYERVHSYSSGLVGRSEGKQDKFGWKWMKGVEYMSGHLS